MCKTSFAVTNYVSIMKVTHCHYSNKSRKNFEQSTIVFWYFG